MTEKELKEYVENMDEDTVVIVEFEVNEEAKHDGGNE